MQRFSGEKVELVSTPSQVYAQNEKAGSEGGTSDPASYWKDSNTASALAGRNVAENGYRTFKANWNVLVGGDNPGLA